MSALSRILEDFDSEPAPAAWKEAAARALREHSLPDRREENWRYANLRALESVPHFRPQAPGAAPSQLPPLPAALAGFERLVFVDGRLHAESSARALARLARSPAPPGEEPPSLFETAGDGRFALLARMFAAEPMTLRVEGTMALEVLFIASAGATATYSELTVHLAADARLELIERSLGDAGPEPHGDASSLSCSSLRMHLGSGSRLAHTRLQQTAAHTLVYDTLSVRLAQRASYQLHHLATGGASARSSVQVQLQGREASADIRALAAAQHTQYADALYTVLHDAPATRSNLIFRGIASERAHVACSADVQVAPMAQASRVLQSLRGLIDGKGAEVNLRPRLTINTDDIQAAHGATTGRLDEDLLFYLLSRGLSPAAARSLLKWAFLSETLATLGPPALRKVAELAVAARLTDAPAAELLQ